MKKTKMNERLRLFLEKEGLIDKVIDYCHKNDIQINESFDLKEINWTNTDEGAYFWQMLYLRYNKKKDSVHHPVHYNSYPVEVIDMMISIWGEEKTREFCIMNAFKYRMRAGLKGDASEDFKKEKWYLNKAQELQP